jgi:hypothetical protein
MNALWDFTAALSQGRREMLLSVCSFDQIVDWIVAGTVDSFTAEERIRSPCHGCRRAFFTIRVSESHYDAFFNSPVGYRAQYCMSVAHGEKQNRRLIEAVTPMCLRFATGTPEPGFPTEMIEASLRCTDAKAWIPERDRPNANEVHIDYSPWLAKLRAATEGGASDQAARSNAEVGVLAPIGSHLEIKGGWLVAGGSEWRDPCKARRAEEIRDYGYT